MAAPVSEEARILAKIVGWSHTVVHSVGLLLAAGLLLTTLWTGYNLLEKESVVKTSEDDDYFNQLAADDSIGVVLFGVSGTFTAVSLAISGPQSYGAYLLLQATNVNMKGSEAIMKLNSFRKIQIVFMCIDLGIIIPPSFLLSDALFSWPILFMLTIFIFHYISIQAVDWFRSELKIACAAEFNKTERHKAVENIAQGRLVVSIYTTD